MEYMGGSLDYTNQLGVYVITDPPSTPQDFTPWHLHVSFSGSTATVTSNEIDAIAGPAAPEVVVSAWSMNLTRQGSGSPSDPSGDYTGTYFVAAGGPGYPGWPAEMTITPEAPSLSGVFEGAIPATAKPGDTISPALQLTNSGSSDIVNGNETTDYYLSTTPDLTGIIPSTLVADNYSLNLQAGQSFTEAQDFTIPQGTAPGTYYLVAQIDANQAIDPSDTNLFAASGPITIGGVDLSAAFSTQPTSTAGTTSFSPGDSGTADFTVTDNGGAS